jgi:uncharacterized damage-inducible protein DinB
MDALREHLLTMLEYEKWANRRWLRFLDSLPESDFQHSAFENWDHIVFAYRVWLNRLEGIDIEAIPVRSEELEFTAGRAQKFIEGADLLSKWGFENPERGRREYFVKDTIHHFLQHGTYHRGQLREKSERSGFQEWPETDFSIFKNLAQPVND